VDRRRAREGERKAKREAAHNGKNRSIPSVGSGARNRTPKDGDDGEEDEPAGRRRYDDQE